MTDAPDENDFVELSFEGEFGNQSPLKGRVLEVNTDPEIHGVTMLFIINDAPGEREIVYSEGGTDDESVVFVRNANITLGEHAEWRYLE